MERKTNAQKSNVTLKDMICSPKAQLREMICEIDIEQFDAGLTNEIKVLTESDCLPYRKCYHVGRVYQDGSMLSFLDYRIALSGSLFYQGGVVLSFLDEDTSSSSLALLDKIKKSNIKLYEKKHKGVLEDGEDPEEVTDLYVPYVLKNHSSTKPTVFEHKKKTMPLSYFEIEYEIVFVSDKGDWRYLNVVRKEDYDRANICDVIRSVGEEIKNQGNIDYDGPSYDGFSYDEESKTYRAIFFDDIGDEVCYEYISVQGFLADIKSVRVVDVREVSKEEWYK